MISQTGSTGEKSSGGKKEAGIAFYQGGNSAHEHGMEESRCLLFPGREVFKRYRLSLWLSQLI